jgi:hypothetical protein
MRRNIALLIVLVLLSVPISNTQQAAGYSSEIVVGHDIMWQIESAPDEAFNLFYTGGGNWLVSDESHITFGVYSIHDDVEGVLNIGNVSVLANDTNVAKDLTLGVWGTPTEWWPGFIVEVEQSDIDILNETAYAAAARVTGNYLNGTMVSSYETVTDASDNEHQCIVFDYIQDSSGFGEPQRTHLAYSLDTGILIEANTSYSFGVPYELGFRFDGIVTPTIVDLYPVWGGYITLLGISAGMIAAVLLLLFWRNRRKQQIE